MPRPLLVIACGALAREVQSVLSAGGLDHVDITCLPAKWHNTPQKIVPALRQKIDQAKDMYDCIVVAFGDCGTGGAIDALLKEKGIERIGGDHCYEMFAGTDVFQDFHAAEPGTFYLTDYLVRFFDTLIFKGLGLDRHPELRDMYFGNYRKLIYLAQTDNAELSQKAQEAAERLSLNYERHYTGFGLLGDFIHTHSSQVPAHG